MDPECEKSQRVVDLQKQILAAQVLRSRHAEANRVHGILSAQQRARDQAQRETFAVAARRADVQSAIAASAARELQNARYVDVEVLHRLQELAGER